MAKARPLAKEAPWTLQAKNLKLDSKLRIPLTKALKHVQGLEEGVLFDAYVDATGRILLEPKISVPMREAWLYRNPEALELVNKGLSEMADGETVNLGSFAKHADEG